MKLKTASLALAFLPLAAHAEGEVRYDKGFVIQDGDAYKLKLGGRVQTRYQLLSADMGDADRENSQHFAIQRARIKASGTVLDPKLSFSFQADFGKGFVTLKDFYTTYKLADGVELQAGQYKRPYSRHQITSSGDLTFVDRSPTDKVLPTGRDIGVQIGSGRHGQPVEWELGVFNGTGDGTKLNPTKGSFSNVPADFQPAVVARTAYNHGKMKGYSEADLEGGPLRAAVGLNVHANLNATNDEDPMLVAGLDVALKAQGFAFLAEAHRDVDAKFNAFFGQAGYLLAERYEPALRFSLIKPDEGDAKTQEIAAGVSVYFFGHNAKWQTDFALLTEDDGVADPTTDHELRSQFQLAF
ncbi:MAG: porin [bacterium]